MCLAAAEAAPACAIQLTAPGSCQCLTAHSGLHLRSDGDAPILLQRLAGVTTGFFLQRREARHRCAARRRERGGSGVPRAHDGRGREGALRRHIRFDHGFEEQAALLGDAAPGLVVEDLLRLRIQ